jgi:hypothetical protein
VKTITTAQYLQLIGLMAVAERHNVQLKEIEKAVEEIVLSPDADHDHVEHVRGHVSDLTYGSRGVDEFLRILEVTVQK